MHALASFVVTLLVVADLSFVSSYAPKPGRIQRALGDYNDDALGDETTEAPTTTENPYHELCRLMTDSGRNKCRPRYAYNCVRDACFTVCEEQEGPEYIRECNRIFIRLPEVITKGLKVGKSTKEICANYP